MAAARLQVLVAAVCFGTTGTAQALGPEGIDPVGVGAARILVGGALLAAVALLAVVAGGAYAVYTLSAKRLLVDGHAPEAVMAVAFGLGAVLLLPALLFSGAGWLLSADGLALAAFLGVVPTALAYVLFARGLRRLSAAETATLTLAEPLTAGLLGAVVLAEAFTERSVAGAALVLAGLLVLALRLPARAVPAAEGAAR